VPSEKRQRQRANSQARAAALREAQRKQAQRRRLIGAAVIVAIGVAAVVALSLTGSKTKVAAQKTTTTTTPATTTTTSKLAVAPGAKITGDTPCPAADGSAARTTMFAKPPPMCIDPAKTYTATMKTDAGDITIALDPTKAPKTVNNFVVLARYHYFDGIAFHRVIPDFMDQGGDPAGTGGVTFPGYKFDDELPQAGDYKAGSVAMANSGPNTNGSQFFLVVSDNGAKSLVPDGKANYSLFGQISDGLDVALKINADGGPAPAGTPKVVHKILSVTITES
jgi:cyclophilin family peptidyl-prolyl cis-trans isomerase